MDEKELVGKIRNSLKARQSRAEITGKLQKQGCKLEYVDALIKKANRPKKIAIVIGSILLALLILGFVGALYFIIPSGGFQEIENPLKDFNVNFGKTNGTDEISTNLTEISLEDIQITPDFFTYLLNELGANSLKKNPLTQEPPTINFDVEEEKFYSIVEGEIETFEGEDQNPDLTFIIEKESLVKVIISETSSEVFKEEIGEGKIVVEQNKDEQTLFLKGYVSLYNSLNS